MGASWQSRDFPGGQVVKTLPSNTGGVVGELRAHVYHHQNKETNKQRTQPNSRCNILTNSMKTFKMIVIFKKNLEQGIEWFTLPECHKNISTISLQAPTPGYIHTST